MSEVKKDQTKRFRRRLMFLGIGLIAGVLIMASLFAGFGRHRWHRLSSEELLHRMNRSARWTLSEVDATNEQRASINAILADLAPDVVGLRGERQALVYQFVQAVEADQVSPDELARIQAASLSLAERAFTRSIDVVLKLSDVLTPEQRKKMVETWRQWR